MYTCTFHLYIRKKEVGRIAIRSVYFFLPARINSGRVSVINPIKRIFWQIVNMLKGYSNTCTVACWESNGQARFIPWKNLSFQRDNSGNYRRRRRRARKEENIWMKLCNMFIIMYDNQCVMLKLVASSSSTVNNQLSLQFGMYIL